MTKDEVYQLKTFFENANLPEECEIELTGGTVKNAKEFYKAHMKYIEANIAIGHWPNETFRPYYNRLLQLKAYMLHGDEVQTAEK